MLNTRILSTKPHSAHPVYKIWALVPWYLLLTVTGVTNFMSGPNDDVRNSHQRSGRPPGKNLLLRHVRIFCDIGDFRPGMNFE